MCGILGQVANDKVNEADFIKNLLKMKSRGPDDYGTYFDNYISLGQTRLSVIDLSVNGHQPMISNCGNYVIIYNGEVYNFNEIKEDLLKKNIRFESGTDTEVILNGFIEYQEGIVSKLNGMFAFSIYDKTTKRLFIARDKSGIKPLYYYKIDDKFAYSSELKALKKDLSPINFEAKILFLLLGYVPEPYSIYEDILMFPAGHYGYYQDNELIVNKFDEYIYNPKIIKPYDEIVSDVSEILHDVIERQLISDAPIGVFLSGGLDSSIVTAIASKFKANLNTLSVVFEDSNFSEEYYQDLVALKFKTKHVRYMVNDELFLKTIDDFLECMEQPTIDGLNTYFVSKAAKETGLTVALSGVGADEIFYGYPSFKNGKSLKFLSKIPCSIIKIFEFSNKYKKLELLNAEKELSYYLPKRALFAPREIARILKIDVAVVYGLIVNLYNTYNASHIQKIEDIISYYELNMYMKNQLLRDSDLFGMANSLEVRVPFLDNKLVDYLLKVDSRHKFGAYNKNLLADVAKNILPSEILKRPKMGFTLPFEVWFKNNIDEFNVEKEVKHKFINGQITWAKFWAIFILKRFEDD
jgi:asparagine synthase (glutamine-hydrolysing)